MSHCLFFLFIKQNILVQLCIFIFVIFSILPNILKFDGHMLFLKKGLVVIDFVGYDEFE